MITMKGIKFMDTIGNRLKKLRNDKNLSMGELAEKLQLSTKGAVSRWERDIVTPRDKTLKAYADYFNVSIDWIKYGEFKEFLYKTVTDEALKGSELTDSTINFYERNYDYSKEIDKHKDFEDDDNQLIYKGYSADYCALASTICDEFLFGYTSNLEKYITDDKNNYYSEYEDFMKEMGYNSNLIIFNTIDLFKKNLQPLEDAFILEEDNKIDRETMQVLGMDKNTIDQMYPKLSKRDIFCVELPNILRIKNKLLEYQKNNTDLDDSVTDEILKLLNN